MQSESSSSSARRIWGIDTHEGDTELKSAQEICNYLNCHAVISRVLWNRGLRTTQALDRFLKPELSQLPDPFSILALREGAERIVEALANEEKIAIYGDYDVDGTCGSAILFDFFRALGVEVLQYQPNRFTEGYGVHTAALARLIEEGARVIITVDCGITAFEPAELCRSEGIDLIVIDHHKVAERGLPDAYAVVNPQRLDDESGLLNLCGSGLAFFFVMGLRSLLREVDFFTQDENGEERKEPNLLRLLDLVAVATVADVMDVRGVNRILITHGLRVLNRGPRPGFKAILKTANVENVTARDCGFVLGPRINAAGRLKTAKSAFDLLICEDEDRALEIALELEEINQARRETQESVRVAASDCAREQIGDPRFAKLAEEIPAASFAAWPRALVLVSPEGDWHEGVVGIVASKIVEEFGRPAFILTNKEGADGVIKGSVRSLPKIDIIAAISAESVAKHLLNFGGHAHAGGVTLERAKLWDFIEAINRHLAITTNDEQYRRERRFDAEIGLYEIDGKLVEELKQLEPCGQKFSEPVLKLQGAKIVETKVMKEKHLKLKLSDRVKVEAVWFNATTLSLECDQNFWVVPQWNEWQGTRRLQLQIKHCEASSPNQSS